jgi:hypothetical protein
MHTNFLYKFLEECGRTHMLSTTIGNWQCVMEGVGGVY